jgi:Ca-activated chloride channel family protein
MYFASPEAFILILFIPLYFYYLKKNNFNSKKGFVLPTFQFIKDISSGGYKVFLHKCVIPIKILTFLLLITSLARPQFGYEKVEEKIKGIDVMLAFDTSKSMLAEDLGQKNRIETSKEVISDFIKRQNGNRLGIVVFSGRSFTLCPLTFDYNILLELLKNIETETVKIDGTAIGDAITNSLYRFEYNIKERNRVIILLTDGENNSGNIQPEKAVAMAIKKGVKIYTIGVGNPEGAPIPIINPNTGKSEYAKDNSGKLLLAKINEKDLINIATLTGGAYFRASDKNTLKDVYNKINEIEKNEIVVIKNYSFEEKMNYLLFPAFILLLIDFLLSKKFLNIIKV